METTQIEQVAAPVQAPTVYTIEYWALGKLNELIAKYNKTATKLGVAPIVFNVETKVRKVVDTFTLEAREEQYLAVTFEGDALRVGAYEFIGTIQHEGSVNLLRSVPGLEIPETFRNVRPYCEHCQTVRYRKDSFVVRSASGEHKQIGRNCLRDFLGHDPRLQLLLLDIMRKVSDQQEGMTEGWANGAILADVLNMNAAVAREYGFGKGSPDVAWSYLFPTQDLRKQIREGKAKNVQITQADRILAQEALEWIRTTDNNSSFHLNMKALVNFKVITRRELNLTGWIVGAYLKAIESDLQRQAQYNARKAELEKLKSSQYLGEVGKRIEMALTLTSTRSIESQFGTSLLCKYVTDDGNVVTWFSSSNAPMAEIGERFTAKFTIKGHKEYKEIKETQVSRLVRAKAA